MFKLVVLSALIACGTAAPSLHHTPDQYAYAGPVATYAAAAPVLLREYQHIPVAKVAESSVAGYYSAAIATPIIEETHEAQFVAAPVLKAVSASAHDSYLRPAVHEVSLAKVGEIVEHVPSSVSHHSSSIVHSSAAVATPVITPVTKTIVAAPAVHVAPVLKEVHGASHQIFSAPVFQSAPVLKEAHGASHQLFSAPVFQSAPVLKEVHGASQDIVEVYPEIHQAPAVHEVSLAKVGEVVEHVPTSVSHHSSSIVHSSAAVATPVITPVEKTIVHTSPIYKTAPFLETVHAPASYAVHPAPSYVPYETYHQEPAYYHSQPILRSW